MSITCPQCQASRDVAYWTWRAARFGRSMTCRTCAGANRSRAPHCVEDVEWLLDAGQSPYEIAARLGYRNVESLRRIMRRRGRTDLSDRLGPDTAVARRMRRARWTETRS